MKAYDIRISELQRIALLHAIQRLPFYERDLLARIEEGKSNALEELDVLESGLENLSEWKEDIFHDLTA